MTIHWGMIGCGDVTERKSGPAFAKAEGSELVAVMRRTPGLAKDYAQRHGVPRWYENADELIHDPQVDAVYVATPPGYNHEYALRICKAGKPAYVEKVMARNYRECREMVEAFEAANLPLFVAYYRRALPRILKAKELIDTGRLGRITGVNYRYTKPMMTDTPDSWHWDVGQGGGGELPGTGCHTLDILDYLFGPIVEVSGAAANHGSPISVEDAVVMHCRFECGALGVGSWNYADHKKTEMLEVTGTNGTLRTAVMDRRPIELDTAAGCETMELSDELADPYHIQQPLIQTIVDQLHGRGTCPSTGVSAARTSKVIDVLLNDYYGGRDDAFWQRPETWPGRRHHG